MEPSANSRNDVETIPRFLRELSTIAGEERGRRRQTALEAARRTLVELALQFQWSLHM